VHHPTTSARQLTEQSVMSEQYDMHCDEWLVHQIMERLRAKGLTEEEALAHFDAKLTQADRCKSNSEFLKVWSAMFDD
jgi:hypothetical protein